jgi:DNA-binding transcriptional MerR regulator
MPLPSNIYLLKDLSRLSGHSIHTLKFYLKRGLIQEVGRSPQTRFRYFDESTLERLSKIRSLRKQQMSLAHIQAQLGAEVEEAAEAA